MSDIAKAMADTIQDNIPCHRPDAEKAAAAILGKPDRLSALLHVLNQHGLLQGGMEPYQIDRTLLVRLNPPDPSMPRGEWGGSLIHESVGCAEGFTVDGFFYCPTREDAERVEILLQKLASKLRA